jgi:hypothetical protein
MQDLCVQMAVISNAKRVSSIPLYETEHGFATNTERSLVWKEVTLACANGSSAQFGVSCTLFYEI